MQDVQDQGAVALGGSLGLGCSQPGGGAVVPVGCVVRGRRGDDRAGHGRRGLGGILAVSLGKREHVARARRGDRRGTGPGSDRMGRVRGVVRARAAPVKGGEDAKEMADEAHGGGGMDPPLQHPKHFLLHRRNVRGRELPPAQLDEGRQAELAGSERRDRRGREGVGGVVVVAERVRVLVLLLVLLAGVASPLGRPAAGGRATRADGGLDLVDVVGVELDRYVERRHGGELVGVAVNGAPPPSPSGPVGRGTGTGTAGGCRRLGGLDEDEISVEIVHPDRHDLAVVPEMVDDAAKARKMALERTGRERGGR